MKSSESYEPIYSNRTRSRRRLRKEAAKRGPKLTAPGLSGPDENLPAVGTMARTKRLILAALRVWELKHGIRD